jgi:pimeloyl-ACP methyl ester carboxylesterase
MANATASPKVDRTIRLQDGRQLAYCEWGALDGTPVVLLHGAPGSRLICPDEAATEAAGVRLLTVDRPGYGQSDPRPGRALLDWPADHIELADQLDLPPCPVVGWSAGGKFALAMGFGAPDRVTAIGLAGALGQAIRFRAASTSSRWKTRPPSNCWPATARPVWRSSARIALGMPATAGRRYLRRAGATPTTGSLHSPTYSTR